ncbi:ATP-dependent nuclease [Pseudonocardia alaniniphila]|uniref:ATP-dependent endonuclease n=1 Tax=Pseudonocardia alaniniphila TaxID=75291 RepID=A0ABS9T9I4_9PSEU|nr:AAA family ATPase [Pseudonocardia alaniniphila]MCH6165177.1 ATP-dependent endonuclease [Pseudonocardia alaniniphila]
MRIDSVEIANFRCIEHLAIEFDNITTFVGPNGAGKSTVLRALDWFFNGESLTEEDVFKGASPDSRQIQVSVTFKSLTSLDREMLGPKYAPHGVEFFTAWRTWSDGVDKFTGKARAYPPFEEVRAATTAADKRTVLNALAQQSPELSIPRWTNQSASLQAMDSWEREHPELLVEAEVSDTHFFGFRGNKKLSGLFDYVLVAADLRAAEESADSKTAIVGRLLDLIIDRSKANDAGAQLVADLAVRQAEINAEHLDRQLADAAGAISGEMELFSAGRTVKLEVDSPPVRVQASKIGIRIIDDVVETTVERQGHGLQRTLLISTLRLLASKGALHPSESTVVLAIEEPELFQHPTQAKLLASVLRQIASGPNSSVQVAYATHSPYFIEPRYFDQLRRITRGRAENSSVPSVSLHQASMESVAARLAGHRSLGALVGRWQQVCLSNLAEAFFANAAVVVEGDHDKAILEGIAARTRPFEVDGIVVATSKGKLGIQILHAILAELGIPTLCVFDNDSGLGTRMSRDGKDVRVIEQQELATMRENREMLRYFGLDEIDYPEGILSSSVGAMPDMVETELKEHWPAWAKKREALIEEGRGASGKNGATYALAAEESVEEPEGALVDFVEAARKLMVNAQGSSHLNRASTPPYS